MQNIGKGRRTYAIKGKLFCWLSTSDPKVIIKVIEPAHAVPRFIVIPAELCPVSTPGEMVLVQADYDPGWDFTTEELVAAMAAVSINGDRAAWAKADACAFCESSFSDESIVHMAHRDGRAFALCAGCHDLRKRAWSVLTGHLSRGRLGSLIDSRLEAYLLGELTGFKVKPKG